MRKTFPAIILCLLCVQSGYAQVTRKVLFLGNSYIYTNNLPQLLAVIADGQGDSLIYDSHVPGGYTLDNHSNDPVSLAKISTGNWDYLVLQEQSQLPALPAYFSNGLYGMASSFRTNSPCGRLMFYMTWGRKNGDALNCPNWPPVCTYHGMDSLLRESYLAMADQHRGELSPVGAAWRYVRQHYPNIELYQPDESHPSAAGIYLAACSFYAAIFKKDPTLINHNYSLLPAVANALKLAAKEVVYDSLSYWDRVPEAPLANFQYTTGSGINTVDFINTSSVNADYYHWDFGNGASSAQKHPSYSYPADGSYTVTLTAHNCEVDTTYTDTHQATITFCPFTPTITPSTLTLCPGTADSLWTQAYSAYQWLDDTGAAIPGATSQYIPCSGSNIYSVKATLNGCTELSQPVTVYSHFNMVNWNFATSGNLIAYDTACIGDTILLSLGYNKPPYPADSLVDWKVNGQPITGYHNDSLLITTGGDYTATVRHPNCQNLDKTHTMTFTFIPCVAEIEHMGHPLVPDIYPNPGAGLYTINSETAIAVTVYDVFGRTIAAQNYPAGTNTLDLQKHPAGLYFLHVRSSGEEVLVRLVKW